METLTDYKLNWCPAQKRNELVLVHYGAKQYLPEMVGPTVNYWKNKPIGGLWTSPINSKAGWREWCKGGFRKYKKDDFFKLKLKPGARVLLIDSMDDLKNLPILTRMIGTSPFHYVDFEYLARLCDAVWLTEKGFHETDMLGPLEMNRWDCESIFIINKECCYQI